MTPTDDDDDVSDCLDIIVNCELLDITANWAEA